LASLVCSWNEWDPLEEVIVGTARGAAEIGFEPGLAAYFPAGSADRAFRGRPVEPALVDEAERQLDGLARLLAERGIVVRRPEPVDHCTPFGTPDWQVDHGRANACPRDALLVVGDAIVEAPMALRARAGEARAYRGLIKAYVRGGARHEVAPEPRRTYALYLDEDPWLTEVEPVFDAACFARCGRDIFWQPDMVSNAAGAQWLQARLGPDFRIHRLRFREKVPMHIDTTLVPIRPGLMLVNPQRPCIEGDMSLFAANGWRLLPAPPSVRSAQPKPGAVSNWISMNVLMLDERTAMVEQAERPTIALFESLGCSVIPVPFDRVYCFGGGLHCCTLDIRRTGSLHSYFPNLD
jgi:glycine amidinotransferase